MVKKISYLFPGQGAQYVGMGKDLYDNYSQSKVVFDRAEEILSDIDIKGLCFEGPIEELTRTANSQVTILVASMASLRALDSNALNPVVCAGLSLGELSALVASRAIGFEDALRLVRRRGELMEQASLKNPGSMASIIGLSFEDLIKLCNESGSEIANLNSPGQIVISGTKESVDNTIRLATEKGAKKCIPLGVSGAFHSSLMKDIAGLFKTELDKVKFSSPGIGVVSNVTADYEKTPEEIKHNLVRQLYSPVRWEESIRRIAGQGIDTFFEIGPGKVLKGLLRRIDSDLKVYNIEKTEDIAMITQL
jgi:[acyl-carrier-protein] S-malonyltransferase